MSNEEHIRDLLKRFADNNAVEAEIREMLDELREEKGEAALKTFMEQLFMEAKSNPYILPVDWKRVWNNITKQTQHRPVQKLLWLRVAAAAIIIMCLSVGGYFYFNKSSQQQIAKTETQQQRFKNDIAPGGNKAILTLADGTQIVLDSAANGTLTQQGNTKIIKLNDGQLAYNAANSNAAILYNIISTPKGGQYQIVLPDKSKVWLNAASSLRFPASFTGKQRDVELTGEAYFEIAKNSSMPFHVRINDMQVEVLGTHFNINAYNDEAVINTTLLEGSIKIYKGSKNSVLSPGQQAAVNTNGEIKVAKADINQVMAWKEGRFYFDGADIKTVMRQLSRWYDVEVNYQYEISDLFVAKISRDVPVSKFLQLLELTELVHFKIEGKKITVMK